MNTNPCPAYSFLDCSWYKRATRITTEKHHMFTTGQCSALIMLTTSLGGPLKEIRRLHMTILALS